MHVPTRELRLKEVARSDPSDAFAATEKYRGCTNTEPRRIKTAPKSTTITPRNEESKSKPTREIMKATTVAGKDPNRAAKGAEKSEKAEEIPTNRRKGKPNIDRGVPTRS